MSAPLLVDSGEGVMIGADVRELNAADLEAAGLVGAPVLDVIRAKCIDCSGGEMAEARKCVSTKCPLWPYRFGTNPFRVKRDVSDEQRAALAARLTKARAARS